MQRNKEVEEGKAFAAVGYLFILCLVPLFLKRDNAFARFHGKQGLALCICEIAAFIIKNFIPFIGDFIGLVAYIVFFALSIFGIYQAVIGNYWKMPIIGDFAEKINL